MFLVIFVLAIIYTELIGYVVHKFLHEAHVPWLSDRHVRDHHLTYYPPGSNMRTTEYEAPEASSFIDKVGFEWIVPIAVVTVPLLAIAIALGASVLYVTQFFLASLVWAWLGFSYMHNSFHIKDFWMSNSYYMGGFLSKWYKETRKLHDIHHNDMTINFGITFFWFDKLLETFTRKLRKKKDVAETE